MEKLKSSEAEPIVVSRLESGQSEKVVYLIRFREKKEEASLVIPEGVRVRLAPSKEEIREIAEKKRKDEFDEEAFWAGAVTDRTLIIKKGKFLARDDKTGKIVGFEFNPNSDNLKKAA